MTYDLVEIFESLQGEGRNTGRPCVFVRFAGCNLACPWCDTDCKRRFSLTLGELVAEAKGFRARSVVLTGGEPTTVDGMPELVAALKREGFWIAVETNGTNDAPWLAFADYVACSPKAEFPDTLRLASSYIAHLRQILANDKYENGYIHPVNLVSFRVWWRRVAPPSPHPGHSAPAVGPRGQGARRAGTRASWSPPASASRGPCGRSPHDPRSLPSKLRNAVIYASV